MILSIMKASQKIARLDTCVSVVDCMSLFEYVDSTKFVGETFSFLLNLKLPRELTSLSESEIIINNRRALPISLQKFIKPGPTKL